MTDFIYTPLSDDEFRTLTLHPGQEDDELRCELSKHPFAPKEDTAKYEALSYLWGSEENPAYTEVRTTVTATPGLTEEVHPWKRLPITRNLEVALKHLRRPNEPRELWVDSLCINQKDENEKPVQIAKMYDIFSNATQVLAWLGKEENDSHIAMKLLQQLGD